MPSLEFVKSELVKFFKNQPVERAWLFGSYARGEQTPHSDIDILVNFDEENYPSLLRHSAMICDLEDKFNTKIDLVPEESLYPSVKNEIEKEKILIYEID